ncbi:MAG: hypothetical protein EA399_01410 [Desulfovibrionales bacterium]|nr:MAG: hypothetical protein EA399_01410 [Desulfovibrionales bacterium]
MGKSASSVGAALAAALSGRGSEVQRRTNNQSCRLVDRDAGKAQGLPLHSAIMSTVDWNKMPVCQPVLNIPITSQKLVASMTWMPAFAGMTSLEAHATFSHSRAGLPVADRWESRDRDNFRVYPAFLSNYPFPLIKTEKLSDAPAC